MTKKKLVRITTVPLSLDTLLSGQLRFMNSYYEVTAVSSDKTYLERIAEKEKVSIFHLEMTRKIHPKSRYSRNACRKISGSPQQVAHSGRFAVNGSNWN